MYLSVLEQIDVAQNVTVPCNSETRISLGALSSYLQLLAPPTRAAHVTAVRAEQLLADHCPRCLFHWHLLAKGRSSLGESLHF